MAKKLKPSEFGGGDMPKSTVFAKPITALSAEERRRLLMRTGSDNPEADPDPDWFLGNQPTT